MIAYVLLFDACRPSDGYRQRMMVFRDLADAESTRRRMAWPADVHTVELDAEPRWAPRKLRPENMIAWVEVWVEGGRLKGEG